MTRKLIEEDDIHVLDDGEFIEFFPGADWVYCGCCNPKCNLVHHMSVFELYVNKKGEKFYQPLQRPVAIRLFRDEEATNWRRRKKK